MPDSLVSACVALAMDDGDSTRESALCRVLLQHYNATQWPAAAVWIALTLALAALLDRWLSGAYRRA